ncbi:MAG: hypothetical protein JXA67_22245 [Micromonosporaceae bacterium]|nr:hypothetical protein [Micromonosporaceae bacterium]
MTSDKARKTAIRDRMAATGEPYSVAARTLHATGTAVIDPVLLAPYPDEVDVAVEELGWRVLPADAMPAARARAEAVWRAVAADRPCRCSGPCDHGMVCGLDESGDGPCPGRLIHTDRYPGSAFSVTLWQDELQCDTCGEEREGAVQLPDVPWGQEGPQSLLVFDGVRHPTFSGVFDDNSGCPDCGAGWDEGCTCDDDGGCPECGAGGRGDPYGECVCYPE